MARVRRSNACSLNCVFAIFVSFVWPCTFHTETTQWRSYEHFRPMPKVPDRGLWRNRLPLWERGGWVELVSSSLSLLRGGLRMRLWARGIRPTKHARCLPTPYLPRIMGRPLVVVLACPSVKTGIFCLPMMFVEPLIIAPSPGRVNHIYININVVDNGALPVWI